MPSPFPLPARLVRVAAVGALGLAVGVGATVAVAGLRGQPDTVASVQRLDLPGQAAEGRRVGPLVRGLWWLYDVLSLKKEYLVVKVQARA